MKKSKFVISALAASSINGFAGEAFDVQKAALDEYFQNSSQHYQCEYIRTSWWTGEVKTKTMIYMDLGSKTFVAVTRDSDGRIESKKTYQIAVWRKDGSNTLTIKAVTTDTETPDAHLAIFDPKSKQMELTLSLINGKYEVARIQCR